MADKQNLSDISRIVKEYPNCSFILAHCGRCFVSINAEDIGKTDLRDGLWHHVVAVLPNDGSTDIWETKLYVDGIEQKYSTFRSKPVTTTAGALVVGADTHNNNHFKGSIDELRIYNKALTPEAILKIMQE